SISASSSRMSVSPSLARVRTSSLSSGSPPRFLSPASAPARKARRHSSITWGATWISRLISPRSSPRRRRSTISAFRFALQRSGSSRSPDDIEFSITTSPIFWTPPTYPSQVSREIGCSIGGPEAMLDGRRNNPGQDRLLDEDGVAALRQAIENEEPPGGGQWNGPKVAVWMSERLGRKLDPARGWDYMRYLDYTPQRPRPRHEKAADMEAQRRYQSRPQAART